MSQVYTFVNGIFPPGVGIMTLTGNSGGAVGPDMANNVNIVGGLDISVTGNPGTNTLTISSTGSANYNWKNVNTTPYAVLATDEYLSVDCSGASITLLLPDGPVLGKTFVMKDRTGNAEIHTIFITTVSGITLIDGAASYTMPAAYGSVQIIGNGTSYELF